MALLQSPLRFHTQTSNPLIPHSKTQSLNSNLRVPRLKQTRVSLVETTKKSRKPRPSFFEEIREKWSSKPSSTRGKYPWQEQDIEIQNKKQRSNDNEKEKVQEEIKPQKFSSGSSSRVTVSSNPVSFPFPTRVRTAPWVQGGKSNKTRFDSEPKPLNLNSESDEDEEIKPKKSLSGSSSSSSSRVIATDPVSFPSRSRNVTAPWVQGGDYNKTLFDSEPKPHDLDSELDEDEDTSNSVEELKGEALKDVFLSNVVDLGEKVELEYENVKKRKNTRIAESSVPEHELKRLRNISLRMVERIKVGQAGITEALVDAIHEKWKIDEVVKLKFEEPLSRYMKRTHQLLESKTGGLVIWRSGSSLVLYRGLAYKLPCVQSFTKQNQVQKTIPQTSIDISSIAVQNAEVKISIKPMKSFAPETVEFLKDLPEKERSQFCEMNDFLDELGPRFKEWTGREPLPVDADLLPAVANYRTPFRLLPYGVRSCLSNKEMTNYRRLARTLPPHFALGRNRQLQGLATAMVKLWDRSAIAKIAIKREVENTYNERMAEELRQLTGGILLSRNKDFIVFYRGNDFLLPVVMDALTERQKLTESKQHEEEQARTIALASILSSTKSLKTRPVAGTLAETIAATSRWAKEPNSINVEEMNKELELTKRASIVRNLKQRLAFGKAKLGKAEKALAKLQEHLDPADLPTDLEIISDEERYLFRKMGLSMKPFLHVGKRGVYEGTIENMHLHWKHRELVKIIVRGRNSAQVKHIAISLEAESGGLLISLDRVIKGYAIILYRGKNYQFPDLLRPKNLLTKRQALARSVELQRREALRHHIADLEEKIELIESGMEETEVEKNSDVEENLYLKWDDADYSSEVIEEAD